MTRKNGGFSSEAVLKLLALETKWPHLSSHAHAESIPVAREGYDNDDWDSPWVDLGGES